MELIKKNLLERKRLLLFTGLLIIAVIYGVYFLSLSRYYSQNNKTKPTTVINNSIFFERPKLKIFDEDIRYLNEFPDTVIIHNKYFLVVVPEAKKDVTTVYDTVLKKKIATFQYVALDYDGRKFLYTKDGIDTFFGNINLHIQCSAGVIKANSTIYCITPDSNNPQMNKLVSINPVTLKKKEVYSSGNYLTAVNIINGSLYIGERDLQNGNSYLIVNGNTIQTPTAVQTIYPIGNNVYFATRSSRFSSSQDVYYEISTANDKVKIKPAGKGRIIFYEETNK